MRHWGRVVAALAVAAWGAGCETGSGTGEVSSEQLFIEDCVNGPYNLSPSFFGASPFLPADTMEFRVQRGDDIVDFSDGLIGLVRGVQNIREFGLGQALPLGVTDATLPFGSFETGVIPPVTLSLYLHDYCHSRTGTVYSVGGTITFTALFSGDLNETNPDNLLTEATFSADMADPRYIRRDGTYPPELVSRVTGNFSFLFQRGQPAQPFP